MTLVKIQKQIWIFYFDFCQNFDVRTFSQWLSNKKHTRNQFFVGRYQKNFLGQMFTFVLRNGILDGSLKFWLLIFENCFLIWEFEVLFKNYIMRWLSMRGNNFIACWAYDATKQFHRTLSLRLFLRILSQWVTNFRACSAKEEITTHFKIIIQNMLSIGGMYFITGWANEHTRKRFHRWLSIQGNYFIAGWAYAEMFESQISRPNRIWFSKISCYRLLRT